MKSLIRRIKLVIDKYRYKKLIKQYNDEVGLFIESNSISDFEKTELCKNGYAIFSNAFITFYDSDTSSLVKLFPNNDINIKYLYITNYSSIMTILKSIYSIYMIDRMSLIEKYYDMYEDPSMEFIDINELELKTKIISKIYDIINYKEEPWLQYFLSEQ